MSQSRQAVQDMLQHGQTLRRREAVTDNADNAESRSDDDESDTGEQTIRESTSRKTTLDDMEGSFSEDDDDVEKVEDPQVDDDEENAKSDRKRREVNRPPPRINPSQYLVMESQGRRDDGGARVALAFAGDDDVVAEFTAEKQKVVERERPKDMDLRLPGWGEWSGPGVKQSQRRKKRSAIAQILLNGPPDDQ